MAWALEFNGTDQWVSIPSGNYFGNLATWEIEAYLKFNPGATTAPAYLIGKSQTTTGGYEDYLRIGRLGTGETARVRYGTTYLEWSSFFPDDGEFHLVRFVRRAGGVHELYIDEVSQGTVTNDVNDTNTARDAIGRASALFSDITIAYIELRDSEGGTTINRWDADSSSGTGSSLPDTSGTADGTLTNFPTDDSQWVSYTASDTTAPTFTSASVPTAGDAIAVQMSESMQVGAGGSSGWTITLGDATISSAAVDGTDDTIINLTPSRTLLSGETFTIGYTQPSDGFQDQATTPNDLATFSGEAVTNNSTQSAPAVPGISAITVQKDGTAVQASDWAINITLVSGGTEVYSGSTIASDASGVISAINTSGGSVGDSVRVEGYSSANNYGFVFTQNLEDNA